MSHTCTCPDILQVTVDTAWLAIYFSARRHHQPRHIPEVGCPKLGWLDERGGWTLQWLTELKVITTTGGRFISFHWLDCRTQGKLTNNNNSKSEVGESILLFYFPVMQTQSLSFPRRLDRKCENWFDILPMRNSIPNSSAFSLNCISQCINYLANSIRANDQLQIIYII